ncbi:CS1-pili formation C-terminal domain-containing protein [Aeromonas sp. XH]|uniref:CS1-pili formation C-terminal domain-containing protein n=1 Tax=Aeromonas sp. XH TaxID=3081770 RepID=UPI002966AF4E|nr:CS1-pili formation C-terminal domain-containing protein [Aeromonas sp. XH]WOX47323.1 CS1-pili formation C-terminal domain-containing protein [Aeromonas sp. XH]
MAMLKKLIVLLAIIPMSIGWADNARVFFMEPSSLTEQYVPIVLVENGDRKNKAVYLSFEEALSFIFTKESALNLDIAKALELTPPGFTMNFSCEKNQAAFCGNYSQFELYYDFYRSELQISYHRPDIYDLDLLDTDPLFVLANGLTYSYSASRDGNGDDVVYGQWLASADYGLTNSVSLHSGLQYDFSAKQLTPNVISLNAYEEGNDLSIFYSKQTNNLSKLGSDGLYGLSYGKSKGTGVDNTGNFVTLLITTNTDGNANLVNKFGELKQVVRVTRGINNLNVNSQDFIDGIVTINIIENGVLVDSYERVLDMGGNSSGYSLANMALGYAKIKSDDNTTSPYKVFAEATMGYMGLSAKVGSIDAQGSYVDLHYRSDQAWQWSGSLYHQADEQTTEYDTRLSYNKNIQGWNFSPSVMYQKNESGQSIYGYMSVFGSIKDYTINGTYSHRENFGTSSAPQSQDRLDLSVASTLHTNWAKIRWSTYMTTSFDDQYGVGLSLTFTPNLERATYTPTVNVNYSGGEFNARAASEFEVNDNMKLTPEVTLGGSGMSGYGLSASFNNELLRSDVGLYRTNSTNAINANLQSNIYISPNAMSISAENKSSQFVFVNQVANEMVENQSEVSINGVKRKIVSGDSQLVHVDGVRTLSSVYPLTDNTAISDEYQRFVMPRFRSKKIEYRSYTDRWFVRGRVIKQGKPVKGAMVVNHVDKVMSDEEGYFELNVSRKTPTITIFDGGNKCGETMISNRSLKIDNEVFVGRLECATL